MTDEHIDELLISKLSEMSLKTKSTKHGITYEDLTDLSKKYNIKSIHDTYSLIKFSNYESSYIFTKQANFIKYMKSINEYNIHITPAHGCKNPDECYIDIVNKFVFIIEKKFQKVSGSVCEKIQTPDFKTWQYSRLIPNYKIIYIYSLSDWFKTNCKSEIEYLDYKNIKYFWASVSDYKDNIIKYITEYYLNLK